MFEKIEEKRRYNEMKKRYEDFLPVIKKETTDRIEKFIRGKTIDRIVDIILKKGKPIKFSVYSTKIEIFYDLDEDSSYTIDFSMLGLPNLESEYKFSEEISINRLWEYDEFSNDLKEKTDISNKAAVNIDFYGVSYSVRSTFSEDFNKYPGIDDIIIVGVLIAKKIDENYICKTNNGIYYIKKEYDFEKWY